MYIYLHYKMSFQTMDVWLDISDGFHSALPIARLNSLLSLHMSCSLLSYIFQVHYPIYGIVLSHFSLHHDPSPHF